MGPVSLSQIASRCIQAGLASKSAAGTVLGIAIFLVPAAGRADVVIDSSLSLTQFQILPSAGYLQFLSPFNASAFAQVFDSLGGFSQQYDSVNDGAVSVGAATGLAYSSAAASAVSMTGSTTAGVNIPNITASAGTVQGSPYALLQGYFEIVGAPGPVSAQVNASLSVSQSLFTSGDGVSASSEAIFNLLMPDIASSPILFYDDPLAIGPNSSIANSNDLILSATVTLQPDTPYYLIADVDPEVKGTSMTPEPSFLLPILAGLAALAFAGGPWLRRWNRSHVNKS